MCQRLVVCHIGSTAITIINSVFENSEDDFSIDDNRKVYAQEQLDSLKFLYGYIEVTVRSTFTQPMIIN